jgi:hypothetical protein
MDGKTGPIRGVQMERGGENRKGVKMNINTTEKLEKIPQTESKGVKAKGASLWGQIAAAVWIGGWNTAQFIKDLAAGTHIDGRDIIVSGLAIAACFTPVYFNLVMDKIREIKLGA